MNNNFDYGLLAPNFTPFSIHASHTSRGDGYDICLRHISYNLPNGEIGETLAALFKSVPVVKKIISEFEYEIERLKAENERLSCMEKYKTFYDLYKGLSNV